LYKEKNREITHLRQEVTLLRNSSDPLLKEKIDKLVHRQYKAAPVRAKTAKKKKGGNNKLESKIN